VLDAADLLSRWKRSERSQGEYRYRPTAPNQQWHTDVMYVWVSCRYYFLVTFIDAFSRYGVHHRLLVDLNGAAKWLQNVLLNTTASRTTHERTGQRVTLGVSLVA
jgi:hypothetical protein